MIMLHLVMLLLLFASGDVVVVSVTVVLAVADKVCDFYSHHQQLGRL